MILSVAVTDPAGLGSVTVFPSGTTQPLTAHLNYTAGETRSNLVVAQVGAHGRVTLWTSAEADRVVDVAGWFSS